MPRIATPVEPVVLEARKRLRLYLRRHNVTPTELSRRAGCNQSTAQRFIVGTTKTLTPKVRAMLSYAGISIEDCMNAHVRSAVENRHIRAALDRVWDGDEASARRLAALIVAVAPVLGLAKPSINR